MQPVRTLGLLARVRFLAAVWLAADVVEVAGDGLLEYVLEW